MIRNQMRSQRPSRAYLPSAGRQAFTLVELLTVIAIISLLVTIILPSLGNARTLARATKTKALIRTIETCLEAFHEEYPPSSLNTAAPPAGVGDPYGNGDVYAAYGAETLVWALTGADLLGTPGFGPNMSATVGSGGLYELDAGEPLHPRTNPYIEPGEQFTREFLTNIAPGSATTRTAWGPHVPPDFYASVYVDSFNSPILYWKANTSQNGLAKYNVDDNAGILERGNSNASDDHPLYAGFDKFIQDFRINATDMPHKKDSYLLISAGPDETFGTRDDLTNYPLTGDNY